MISDDVCVTKTLEARGLRQKQIALELLGELGQKGGSKIGFEHVTSPENHNNRGLSIFAKSMFLFTNENR